MSVNRIQLEEFKDRIIFVSMYNDIDWTEAGHLKTCFSNSVEVQAYAHRFPKGRWSFFGPGTQETWYGTHTYKSNGLWNQSAEMINASCRRWTLRISSNKFVGPRIFEMSERRKLSIQPNGDLSTAELLFVSHKDFRQPAWCAELAQQISDHSFSSTENPVANMNEQLGCRLSLGVLSILTDPPQIDVPAQGNLLRSHSERFETLPEHMKSNSSDTAGFCELFSGTLLRDTSRLGCGGAGACRARYLERMRIPTGCEDTALEVKVTYHFYQCGIEVRV